MPNAKRTAPKPEKIFIHRKPIRRQSPRAARLRAEYNAAVKVWIALPENHWCVVVKALQMPRRRASQCHHKHGRGWRGELTMVKELWLPVSAWGHDWIDRNKDKARSLGLLAPMGLWNTAPPMA